jgi:hypothetical protein
MPCPACGDDNEALNQHERSGALRSFSRRLDPAALGYNLMALLSLSISQTRRSGRRARRDSGGH